MSIVWDLGGSTSYRQLPLLLAVIGHHIHVVACAFKSSKEECKLQKTICHNMVSGLKIVFRCQLGATEVIGVLSL